MATFRRSLPIVLFVLLPFSAPAVGFEAVTLGFSQAWSGNGYVPTPDDPGGPYDFDVTGSDPSPIDGFLGIGTRIVLIDGLLLSGATMGFSPALEIGSRRYVLFESGRVAPAQIETATGAEGNTLGRGSARVVTFRIPLPLSYEFRFAEGRHAVGMSISPTFVLRVRAGAVELRDADTDLSGMYDFFYSNARFIMPELSLGYRYTVSDALDVALHATYGLSIADVMDTSLPWYDQMRIGVGATLGLRLPFGSLAREREGDLPEGVEPFPEGE